MNQAVKKHAVLIGLYGVLALLMSLPLVFAFTSHVAGSGGDPWQTMWRFEAKEAFLRSSLMSFEGSKQFLQHELFGAGEPRLVNLSVWPWMWLQVLFGQPVAYNMVWLLSFVLSGYGMYLLANWLFANAKATRDKKIKTGWLAQAPAFLAGVTYMFLPYHVAQAQGHFGAMQLQWLPLIILAAAASVRRPNIWKVLALASLLIIQAWSEHHYMLWLGLFGLIGAAFGYRELVRFWRDRSGPQYTALLAGLLGLFVVLPYWPTIVLANDASNSLQLGVEQVIRFSADPFAYLVPASFHPIWGGLSLLLFTQHFTGNIAEATHFLGVLPLLLVLFFHQSIPRRQKVFWLVVSSLFALISFGPRLHLLGRVTRLPLPYDLIDQLPVFSAVRAVARAGVMVALAGAVLLAWVLKKQLRRGSSAIVVFLIIMVEFLFVPVPLQSAVVPSVYEAVRAASGEAIIEIPAATNYVTASRSLYASRGHGKKVIGNIALERAWADEELGEVRTLPVLRQLLYLRTTHLLEDRMEFFGQTADDTLPDVLRWLDARIVLVHIDSVSATQLRAVRHLLEDRLNLPAEQVDDVLLYRLPDGAGGDGVFAARDDGWQNVGYDANREAVFGEIYDQAQLTIYNVMTTSQEITLSFIVPAESQGSLQVSMGETVLAEVVDVPMKRVSFTLKVAPGSTVLEWRSQSLRKVIIQDPLLRVR